MKRPNKFKSLVAVALLTVFLSQGAIAANAATTQKQIAIVITPYVEGGGW